MANFRICFFWEQEKTNLRYSKDYIVDEKSAAPIIDNTERCGIAADHSGMCRFEKATSQGFRTAVAALRRYGQEAPEIINHRLIKTADSLNEIRRHKAMEMLRGIPPSESQASTLDTVVRIDRAQIRQGSSEQKRSS